MIFTQQELYELLQSNPLKVPVAIGDVEDMNGQDYIFVDFVRDELIGSDNKGVYKTSLEMVIATRQFDNRTVLLNFLKDHFNLSVRFDRQMEFEYYVAQCSTEILLYEES